MLLMPKRVKHRKTHRGSRRGICGRGTDLSFGEYGLQALTRGWVRAAEIEAARVAINRHIKRHGKLTIRVFPDKPITSKPAETRMGKGKGAPSEWVVVVRPGRVLFELDGVPFTTAREAFRLAAHKLRVRSRFVVRTGHAA
jgi:large subunit ribosomal protein L16